MAAEERIESGGGGEEGDGGGGTEEERQERIRERKKGLIFLGFISINVLFFRF